MRINYKIFLLIGFLILTASFSLFAEVYKTGVTASYYAEDFHGKKTSNGERFNMNDFTCAHKSLPFNTILKVTNLANGKTCEVRVNDRGPFVLNREIDLSKAAATKLGMIGTGTTKVKLEIVKKGANTKISQQTAASATKIMKKMYGDATTSSTSATTSTSTTKKLEPGTYWDIQLGAFKSKDNAKAFASKVSKAGFKDIVLQTTDGITRVAIKKVPASNVTDTQNKLASAGFTEQTLKQRK
ncbi:MAG: septal ring lytic transglycosylase RlpA family protein [Treponema sp.]|nr:septal ring lytic transglycosylase RlpA family protein [Treponema sp.]